MIFLELVPTSIEILKKESNWALSNFNELSGINVPDILRVSNRSYDSAISLADKNINAIPHIRACDFNLENLIKLCAKLEKNKIKNILLISGDPPPNPLQPIFKHNLIEVFKTLSSTFSNLNFFAGCDPYRQSLKKELCYSEMKINAGAKGLFTQPIFDVNLAKILIKSNLCNWYIGISPVLTEKSYNYWVTRNNVFFNTDFKCDMNYNVDIGKKVIDCCKEENQHNYIMPIKTDISKYLKKLFK